MNGRVFAYLDLVRDLSAYCGQFVNTATGISCWQNTDCCKVLLTSFYWRYRRYWKRGKSWWYVLLIFMNILLDSYVDIV